MAGSDRISSCPTGVPEHAGIGDRGVGAPVIDAGVIAGRLGRAGIVDRELVGVVVAVEHRHDVQGGAAVAGRVGRRRAARGHRQVRGIERREAREGLRDRQLSGIVDGEIVDLAVRHDDGHARRRDLIGRETDHTRVVDHDVVDRRILGVREIGRDQAAVGQKAGGGRIGDDERDGVVEVQRDGRRIGVVSRVVRITRGRKRGIGRRIGIAAQRWLERRRRVIDRNRRGECAAAGQIARLIGRASRPSRRGLCQRHDGSQRKNRSCAATDRTHDDPQWPLLVIGGLPPAGAIVGRSGPAVTGRFCQIKPGEIRQWSTGATVAAPTSQPRQLKLFCVNCPISNSRSRPEAAKAVRGVHPQGMQQRHRQPRELPRSPPSRSATSGNF